MVSQDELNKLYDVFIFNKELTTKLLKEAGFSSNDLTNLVKSGVLQRVKRGSYDFVNANDLYAYGKKFLGDKAYDKARICFRKCYELDASHIGACLQLFFGAVQNRNYEVAFEYFDKLWQLKKNDSNNNLYLFLLSMVTRVPDEYLEIVKGIKFRDVLIHDNCVNVKDVEIKNKVRIYAYNHHFVYALKQLRLAKRQVGSFGVYDYLFEILLFQVVEFQNSLKKDMLDMVFGKQYADLVLLLEDMQNQRILSELEQSLLFLAKEILSMKETGVVSYKVFREDVNLFGAIRDRNYELAMSLNDEFCRGNLHSNENIIGIILKDVIALESDLKGVGDNQEDLQQIDVDSQENIVILDEEEHKSLNIDNTFVGVVNLLAKKDLSNFVKSLRIFLNNIDKIQYEFLIVDLVKISLLENDLSFIVPIATLTDVGRDVFNFDVSEYIHSFYEELAQNKFDLARVYLDIIINAGKLGQECTFGEVLKQVLDANEKSVNFESSNELLEKLDVPETQENLLRENDLEVLNSDVVDSSIEIDCVEEVKVDDKVYDASELVSSKLEQLYARGIVILKAAKKERREGIHRFVETISDVVSFDIGDDFDKRVVLRFKPYISGDCHFDEVIKAGNQAYRDGNYDLCIENYRKLLEWGTPKSWVYAKLGLAYMKKFSKAVAIDYLTVATELSRVDGVANCDFTGLIAYLKGEVVDEDKKPLFKMSVNDFESDVTNYFGIKNIKRIADMIASGLSLDEVCQVLSLNDERKSLIGLILARECYVQESFDLGDQYLNKVEKIKNKTKRVKALLEDIRKNKRFYKNRIENKDSLILVMKIKKV